MAKKKFELEEDYQVSQMLQWLMPWMEKSDDETTIGQWQDTLPTIMMQNLLRICLTKESCKRVQELLEFYHPLDRAAMAYALVVYLMTGRKMTLKNGAANQHYRIICQTLKEDMPELFFAGHMRYMMRRYGRKRGKK